MADEIYQRLAGVLDTLPNGFPSTESGVEIRILKKIFEPDEAVLFCDLRMAFETASDVASRTGRPSDGLEAKLASMGEKGQLFAIELGGVRFFRMMPWVFGIYELQLPRIDRELAQMCEEYGPHFGGQFFLHKPQFMQTLPVEETITPQHEALPYERVSYLIEHSRAFLLNECICKKERALLGHPCDRPVEVCLAMAPVEGIFDNSPHGRVITKEEAYALLKKAEDLGLVHFTANVQKGHIFICNCCSCCCGVLRAINEFQVPARDAVNSHYYARIDAGECTGCGICIDERCQVGAIEDDGESYRVIKERCIGCGLCIGTCPGAAISLVHKSPEERVKPPVVEQAWYEERGRARGVDFTPFK
jgi:Na+-translocating ferredoxin:NAD+ oxidoreductase subunit B